MSLNKAVIMGCVVRNPEKRFTSNNVPITSFTINIGKESEENLLRVIAMGKLAETTADNVVKNKTVVVEGKLQTAVAKTTTGVEKKVVEIVAQSVEVVGESAGVPAASSQDELQFEDDFVSSDDLIGEDEIPF